MKQSYYVAIGIVLALVVAAGIRYFFPKTPHIDPTKLTLSARVDYAIEKSKEYLYSKQSSDGAWRSETYGLMRSGQSMTPFTLYALTQLNERNDKTNKGLIFILDQLNNDGSVGTRGIQDYPTYSTALSVVVLKRLKPSGWQDKINKMTRYLESRQLASNHNWIETDSEYGGWGNSIWLKKPSEDMPKIFKELVVDRVDLSHTVFVLEALDAAKISKDTKILKDALIFVKKCQNYKEEADSGFYDGGFIFAPNSVLGNKAGITGKDNEGITHYRSYASMTTDGIQSLLFLGVDKNNKRIQKGIKWLMDNFDVNQAGGFPQNHQPKWSKAVIYYYYWSITRLFKELNITHQELKTNWAKEIAAKLLQLQKEDGSWENPITLMKEDDPLISTSLSIMALDYCKGYLK